MGKFWVIPVIIVLGLAICVLVALRAPSVTTVRLPDIEVRVYSQVQGSSCLELKAKIIEQLSKKAYKSKDLL